KVSETPFVSPGTRLDADELNTTTCPLAEIAAKPLPAFAWAPVDETLTRVVIPVCRSRTNTSCAPLVSPGTRLDAVESNSTYRPSAEMPAGPLLSFAWTARIGPAAAGPPPDTPPTITIAAVAATSLIVLRMMHAPSMAESSLTAGADASAVVRVRGAYNRAGSI